MKFIKSIMLVAALVTGTASAATYEDAKGSTTKIFLLDPVATHALAVESAQDLKHELNHMTPVQLSNQYIIRSRIVAKTTELKDFDVTIHPVVVDGNTHYQAKARVYFRYIFRDLR